MLYPTYHKCKVRIWVSRLLALIVANFRKYIVSSALCSTDSELFVNNISCLQFIPDAKETVSLVSQNVFQVEQAVKSRGFELVTKGSVYKLVIKDNSY